MSQEPPRQAALRIHPSWEIIKKIEAARLGLPVKPLAPLYKARDLGTVLTEPTWLEVPLGPKWLVAYRLVSQAGQPVVAEVRVFPQEPGRQVAGRWSGEWRGINARVPRGGITARLLREVRIGEHGKRLQEILTKWAPTLRDFEVDFTPSTPSRPMRGRKPLPDIRYARVADRYVKALMSGARRPVAVVARALRIPVPQARDFIHRARGRRMLTKPTKQGRAGGALTPHAEEILKKHSKKRRRHAKR
jgi:hypothetical protein